MYSLFSNFDNYLTMSEASQNTYLTSTDLFAIRTDRMLGAVNKNLQFSKNYSKDYPIKYHKIITEQIKVDEILNVEYFLAIKRGNFEFAKMYEKWKSKTLLDYVQPIEVYNKLHQIENTSSSDPKTALENYFTEGKLVEPENPNSYKDKYLDYFISAAFFWKFWKRMQL